MSQKRKLRRAATGNVIQLPLPPRGTDKHVVVERLVLDTIEKARSLHEPKIEPIDVLQGICRITAFLAAALEVPEDQLLSAMATLLEREKSAIRSSAEKGPGDAG